MPWIARHPRAALRLALLAGLLAALVLAHGRAALAQTPQPDLTVGIDERTADPTVADSIFKWDIIARNAGTAAASGVTLRFELPARFTAVSATPPPASGFTCSISGSLQPLVTCQNGSLPAGAGREVRVEARTPAQLNFDSELFGVAASIDPGNSIVELNEANNTSSDSMSVERRADLDPDLSAVPLQVTEGQELTYPVTVRNVGNRTATGVRVRVGLPADVTFVRTERDDFALCLRQGATVTCSGATIAAGGAASFRVVTAVGNLGGSGTLLFGVTADPDDTIRERNETNNTASALTQVAGRPDLTVTTATSTPWMLAAPWLALRLPTHGTTIRVTVRNDGRSPSGPTTVRYQLRSPLADADIKCPSGMGVVDGSCVEFPPAGCSQSGTAVTCEVSSLAPGASTTLVHSASYDWLCVPSDIGDPFCRYVALFETTVTVDPSNQVQEGRENNNTATLLVRTGDV